MFDLLLAALVAFLTSFCGTKLLIPKLRAAGIVGVDYNKPSRPKVSEMGGIAVVLATAFGILSGVGIDTFFARTLKLDYLLAGLSTILLMFVIGVIDDLLKLRQLLKAVLPLFASFPLVAVKAGVTSMSVPGLGSIDFGLLYPLLLIPIGIAGASNATNMLAGFNGLEAGMGSVACLGLATTALLLGAREAALMLLSMAAALLAFLRFNWYPAKVFMGDVGTLCIGATIAAAVIVGNFEAAGVIVILPYAADFLIKAVNRFPSLGWWGELTNDGKKLVCRKRPVGLCQLVIKLLGGVSEQKLVSLLILTEVICSILAILFYIKPF